MDTPTVVQRKKLGRPPKAASTVRAPENVAVGGCGGAAFMQTELGDEAALVAISPIPDEQSSVTSPAGIMDASAECRRSSRKKIIKFDVRDLLNKHRKPHKIQIEARIDSNAPSVSSKAVVSAGTDLENIATNNKEKCFIEKTSIIQRSGFDNSQHGSTQVPIPIQTQIFKPNQASSLIVAQMESISSSNQVIQKPTKSIAYPFEVANKLNTTIETEIIVPKRRGRPPKNRSLIEKPLEEENKCDSLKETAVFSEISEQNKVQTTKIPQSQSVNATEIHTLKTAETSFQVQFEKSLCKSEVPECDLSTKCSTESKTEITVSKEQNSVTERCSKDSSLIDVKPISDCEFEKIYPKSGTKEGEGESDCNITGPVISPVETITIVIDDSNEETQCLSEKKVETTETENNVVGIEQKNNTEPISESVCKEKDIIETKAVITSTITLPLKKQLSKLHIIQNEVNADESANDSTTLCLSKEKNVTPTEVLAIKDLIAESEATRKTSTPTPQRSERRSGRRIGDGSNKTLEETFAEIAANSTKAILDLSTSKIDEPSLSETELATEEIALQSMQTEVCNIENVTLLSDAQTQVLVENELSSSVSPKEEPSDQDVLVTKRRGRKPKPKSIVENDDSAQSVTTKEQETCLKTDEVDQTDSSVQDKMMVDIPLKLQRDSVPSNSPIIKVNENQKPDDQNHFKKLPLDSKIPIYESLTQNTVLHDLEVLPSSSKISETTTTAAQQQHEHRTKKKERHEETSPSKRSSSHHKHRKHEDYKSDHSTSKHRSSSTEKSKKPKKYDTEEAKRNERKSMESSKTPKLSSKEKVHEVVDKKRTSTPESSKKSRDKSVDGHTKKIHSIHKEKSSVDSSKKLIPSSSEKPPHDNNQQIASASKVKPLTDDVKKSSSSTKEKSENESVKKVYSVFKERSAVDSLKKSRLLSPERASVENCQKVATTKERLTVDEVKKQTMPAKEKPENENVKKLATVSVTESVKKSTLLSEERSSGDIPKSAKTKEKPVEDVKKSCSTTKEKLNSDSTKKPSSTTKERHSTEYSIKKSSSSSKEKLTEESVKKVFPTPDDRHKKSILLPKDKSGDDSLKKVTSASKEKTVPEAVGKIDTAFEEALTSSGVVVEKKHHDKKKHKLNPLGTSLSTSKSKSTSSSSVPSTPLSISKEHSSSKSSSSGKNSESKSHRRKRKHKETPEVSSIRDSSKSLENSDEKIPKSSNTKDDKTTFKKELKDAKKQARKERQKKLTEAFEAAMEENPEPEPVKQPELEGQAVNLLQQRPITPENRSEIYEIALPPTPGESDAGVDVEEHNVKPSSPAEQSVQPAKETKATVVESDPLYDIEKFIEAGVNLLKRDYKLAEDDVEVKTKGVDTQESIENQPTEPSIKVEYPTEVQPTTENVITEQSSVTENLDIKHEALDYYETPVNTPASTQASLTPSSSPTPNDNSVDTYYYSDGVRRSHRLKKITSAPKALVGRGLVRDRDRERLAMRDDVETKSYYSMEDHLMDLAEVEAKNAKFLKEMEERLSNFEVIKENEYHCERVVSREARKMVCDCFLTSEEAERGELGCGEDCLNRLLMIECGVNCKVGERCTNRRFQKYLCAPCRVFRTEKKGFGIMADVEIHPGEFIMEYVGEVLDSDEFEDRRVAYSQDKNRHYYFMALRSDAIIDATIKGNVSRFINHSCDPNAETQKWTVNGELRIGFFSRKAIMPGEEITFDYQYQRYGREAQRCYCESANCRGWIGEEPSSDEGEQIDDEDDDDDDEFDEDESDVVSMVKGLMSVEDGDDEDGKDDIMSEQTRRTIQDAAVKAQLRKNQSIESEEANAIKEPSLDGETDESQQKFMAYLSKISAKIELHKKNVREEKKRKRQHRKQAASERRPPTTAAARFLEDPDLEDEIDFLSRCGLKNQSDTLRLSRLMVRAKLVPTRLNLLAILRAGELACRRLFLDYHGLYLLHGWINEDGRIDMSIRMALLETLECLPIPNKTVLTDSKVYQAIRGWCNNETKTEGSSSSPSDDSSKESASGNTTEKQTSSTDAERTEIDNESPTSELEKLASKLLNSWDSLPEIFRIPKRERIEQMKEHEREADRQYAATVEADNEDEQKELSTDRYQRDRFERRFGRPQGNRTITVLGAGGIGLSGKRLVSSDVLSPDDTKHLSKEQRRELFAAKVARDEAEKVQAERRREFETKCTFFGLDPLIARPEDIPFCVSDSGKWYNERRQLITTPPAFAHVQTPIKPMSTNPTDYYLPSAATKLPPEWTFAITDQGKIYYYHLKHRVPQWEPPTLEQINKTKWSDDESESEEDETEDTEELSEEQIKEIEAIETQEELNVFLKKMGQEQRQSRYKRLVDERPISPRREEDRIYNQIEMRKYKENKEKIKKRKEEIRRRRSEAIKNSMLNMCTLGSLDEKPSTSTAIENIKTETESSDMPDDALPIQDYLLSSDEDNGDIDDMKAECNNSPLLDKIVQGDKIVDELDALTTKRQLKRPLPPHRDFTFDLNIGNINSESLLASIEKIEQKKRKQEKKEKSKRSKESSDAKYRKLKEKFRCEIAGIIVQHLKPYRKDSCIFGRIKSNEDFNHLAKKLTHFVMIKELKYCESVGQTLVVTESVKNKSREFIRKYMAKYETGYVKPDNDPEFKDIPYTL